MYLLVEWISLVGLKLNLKILKVERFKNIFFIFSIVQHYGTYIKIFAQCIRQNSKLGEMRE